MSRNQLRGAFALALAVAATLATPTIAAAAYTTHITDPGPGPLGPNYLTNDQDTASGLNISGNTTGLANGSSVDIRCYFDDDARTIADDVTVTGAHFSVTGASIGSLELQTCTLRAVEHNTAPTDLTGLTGPLVGVGLYDYDSDFAIDGGPNDGEHWDFYEGQSGLKGASDIHSIGRCGLYDSNAFDASYTRSLELFYCNAFFRFTDDPGGRSLLQVDGTSAHFASDWGESDIGSNHVDTPGLPNVEFTRSLDPSTGDVVLHDNEGVAFCADAGCDSAKDAGIRVQRTVEVDHDGQQQVFTDVFTSTDGRDHAIDGIYQNDVNTNNSSLRPGWVFPGESSYVSHNKGDTEPVTDVLPQSILVRLRLGDDSESVNNPRGAISLGSRPDAFRFVHDINDNDYAEDSLGIDYKRTVPATGSLVIKQAYSTAITEAEVAALRADAEDRVGSPTVTIASPANGSKVALPTAAVRGTAVDTGGVAALTVNGTPVAIAPDGTWTAAVALTPGANTITAAATDHLGNTGTAAVTFTAADLTGPGITGAKLSRTRFRVGGEPTAKVARSKVGTKLSYSISEPAAVTFTISRKLRGRMSGTKCRAATHRLRHHKRCLRLKAAGTLRRSVAAGSRSLAFTGRIGHRALVPGRYRIVLTAIDRVGNRSKPVNVRFRIRRR